MAGEDDDAIEADEQLALADGEERLPWLESDDDYEQPGIPAGSWRSLRSACWRWC
jgi:hypothetical protein